MGRHILLTNISQMLHLQVGHQLQTFGVLLTTVLQQQTIVVCLTQQNTLQDFHPQQMGIQYISTFLLLLKRIIITQ
jgi:hypothetical protein